MNFPPRYKFVCPFCERVYAKSLSHVLLGPGIHPCKSCHRTFADHLSERPAATTGQMHESRFPEKGIFYLVGNLAPGILLSLGESHHLRDLLLLAIFCAGSLCYLRPLDFSVADFKFESQVFASRELGGLMRAIACPEPQGVSLNEWHSRAPADYHY